ncbi:hypothetical protein [Aeromonas jandaei]|uniref:hypothetical protein n=1 Tax=Aeromonas jandaei TaxID=650 RepID=UPI001ADDCB12|nr:hypothetical protein [Aeromonas jandaei]QTL92777.1 hypothetical protein AjGTCBM29_00612 [Aeromonas jandaei]
MMELPKETEISTHFLSDIPLYFIQYLVKNNIDLNDFVVKKTVTLNTEETCQHALKIIDIAAFIDDYISHEISLTSLMSCYREVENSVSEFERHTLKTARQELDKAFNSIKEIKLQLMSSIEYRSIYESLLGIPSHMDFMSKKPMAMPEDTYENKDELLKFLDETKKHYLIYIALAFGRRNGMFLSAW